MGIHGKLSARPNARAVRAATAIVTASSTMLLRSRLPTYCSTWMPTTTAPIAHAGMLKKNLANGYSAMYTMNTASSIGPNPAWPMFSATPTSPGITASSSSMMANRLRPTIASTCRPKYQKMAIVMTVHRSGTLANGHVTQAPQLAVLDVVRQQPEVLVDRLAGRPDEQAGHARDDDEHRRGDVERADAEPRIAGATPLGHREREPSGHGPQPYPRLLMVQRPPAGTIPDSPGSYQFKDAQGRVIYVGKASSLRQRLSNYFGDPRYMHPRTAQMVQTAESVEWTTVRNEVEALMLEYSLIKQHQPRFNVRLRDDKSYPFLAVTVDEEWPRALVMRGRKRKGTRYFGPYAHAYAIRDTLDELLRSFPIRTCSPSKFNQHERLGRPCLLFHIEKCSGPCVGEIDAGRLPPAGRRAVRLPGG